VVFSKALLKLSPSIYKSKHDANIQKALLKSWRCLVEHRMELIKVRFVLCLAPEETCSISFCYDNSGKWSLHATFIAWTIASMIQEGNSC